MIKTFMFELLSLKFKPIKLLNELPIFSKKLKTIKCSISESGCNFTQKETHRIYGIEILKILLLRAITFLMCFIIAEPIASAILSTSEISPILSFLISVYISNNTIPNVLEELGINS